MGKKKEVEKGKKITWVQNCMLAIYSKGFEFEEYKFHSKGASKFHIHLKFFGSVT